MYFLPNFTEKIMYLAFHFLVFCLFFRAGPPGLPSITTVYPVCCMLSMEKIRGHNSAKFQAI